MKNNIIKYLSLGIFTLFLYQCNEESANSIYVPPSELEISVANDIYLYDNNGESLFERFGTATRWRWNDGFINPDERATPIRSEFVIPATQLVDYLWIQPYTAVGSSGEAFIKELFPPELVYIGSSIFQTDGSEKLGFAEGGARITLLTLNDLDFQDRQWLADKDGGLFRIIHHEFSHIVQQNYGNPVGFNTISERYVGIEWINTTDEEALKLGMVTPYAASSEFEDFVDLVAQFIITDPDEFDQTYIDQADCSVLTTSEEVFDCIELNNGKALIKQKVDLMIEYYENQFNIDIKQVRDEFQQRINNLIETGVIPD